MREAGRRFWFVAYALACVMAGTNIASPLFSTYQHRFGFSPFVLTVVFAVYIAVIVPSLLVFGSLADSVGRRPVLLFAVVTAIAGSLVLAGARDVGWLVAGRVAEGVSFAAAIGTGAAALDELHGTADRRLAATVTTGAFLGGAAVGPVMTGVLAEYAPHPLQLTYAVHVVMLALAVAMLAAVPEPLPAGGRPRWRPGRIAIPRGSRSGFALLVATAAAAGTCGSFYLALASSFASDILHTGNLAVAGGIVAVFLVGGAAAQIAAGRLEPRTCVVAGLVVVAGGMALGAAAAGGSLGLLALGSTLAVAGQGIAFRGTLALVQEMAPAAARADITSGYYAAIYVGTGCSSLALGLAATASTLAAALPAFALAIGAIAAAMALVGVRVRRTVPETAAPVPAADRVSR